MTSSITNHPMVKVALKYRFIFLLVFVCSFLDFDNKAFAQRYDTPGAFTYVVPSYDGPTPGSNESVELRIEVTIVGAGGGGGRGNGAGGGGGGQVVKITRIVNQGDVFTGFIGTGGVGRTLENGAGGNGSNSIFDNVIASGGTGGQGGPAGRGGNSSVNVGGNPGEIINNNNGNLRAGGGGAGAGIGQNGRNGVTFDNGATGGNGGFGIDGFGGGGGGTARGNGNQGNGNRTFGIGRDGGRPGTDEDNPPQATNGGGGGGGIIAGGRGSHGVVIIDFQSRILPVKYLSLKATYNAENRTSEINWTTAKEWENSHFEIERAIGQVNNFENVGSMEGVGFSDGPVDYQFKDKKLPLTGGMAYYRLKQIDFDGSFQYSEVLSVRIPSMQVMSGVWRAYPNPTKGQKLNLDLVNSQEYADEPISLRIISPLAENHIIEGSNIRELSDLLSEKLQSSSNGLYIIEVYWGQKREYIKVLKN